MKQAIIIFIVIVCGFFYQACDKDNPGDLVLFDFEEDSDLDSLNWKCQSLFSISDEFSSQGLKSLKLELYPSDYPGVSFRKYEKNWEGYQAICFDVYNPADETIDLIVRIDDYPDNVSYSDRLNKKIILSPGENSLNIPFIDMKTAGTQRELNIHNIYKLILFVVRPEKKTILFIDNIRLSGK